MVLYLAKPQRMLSNASIKTSLAILRTIIITTIIMMIIMMMIIIIIVIIIKALSKFKDFEIETTRMCGMKTEAVSVIAGALGLIRKGIDQNLGKMSGASNIREP